MAFVSFPQAVRSDPSEWEKRGDAAARASPSLSALLWRIAPLALLFTLELLAISVWLDRDALSQRTGLIGVIYNWGSWILHAIVGFAAIFAAFAYLKSKVELQEISRELTGFPIRWKYVLAHGAAMSVFAALSLHLYRGEGAGGWPNSVATIWFVAGCAGIVCGALVFLPRWAWVRLVRSTGILWAYAWAAVILGCLGGYAAQWLWEPASRGTFQLCRLLLAPFVSNFVVDPSSLTLGTQHFLVDIAPGCSGLEGIGLILAVSTLWLVAFRKECRFPQALVLIPVGMAVIYLSNAIRIAALILIGNAGAERIAEGGFHSQAGWIAFTAVSLGFIFAANEVPWFTSRARNEEASREATENPTAAYLMPFLVIVAAGMIATLGKADGGTEWLYPLRFFAALAALWIYRRSYASLDWRVDWSAPMIGVLAFLIWIASDRLSNAAANNDFSLGLASVPTAVEITWFLFRIFAAVVTVPVAEELAFRGYLMRRLISPEFELVSLRQFSWVALLVSSVAYGLLHGGYWIGGILAGILFGLAAVRKGRMGDAVVAHATANALLAAYVISFHKWHLW